MTYIATGPNYSATIPAALGLSDARQIACADSGLMPWQITVERRTGKPWDASERLWQEVFG